MKIKKLVIKSNIGGFGLLPAFNEEIEQHIKIRADGRVTINRYVFGFGYSGHYVKAGVDKFSIPPEKTDELFKMAESVISTDDTIFATDVGDWKMKICYTDGSDKRKTGSSIFVKEFQAFNEKLREILHRDYRLFLLDGGYGQDDEGNPEDEKYIYLSVEFTPGGKTYYYLTDNENIQPGDRIIVPVGEENIPKEVTVVRRETFSEDNAPMDPDLLKHVLKKMSSDPEIHFPEGSNKKIPSMSIVDDAPYSLRNRELILKSKKLGCYDCCRIFTLNDVSEDDWVDDGDTLSCPFCGNDTVIGDASGFPITEEFLKAAHKANL